MQIKCQQQAQLFQRASEIHAAAKETVALAESRFMSHQHEWNFDQAWQDMLNHATLKVSYKMNDIMIMLKYIHIRENKK